MPPEPIRVLIVDDEEDMRFLVRALFEQAGGDVVLVGEAGDAEAGLARWRELRPDAVVLDYLLPRRNGLELAGDILREAPDTAIFLFTAHADPATLLAAELVGVREVVLKDRVRQLTMLLRATRSA